MLICYTRIAGSNTENIQQCYTLYCSLALPPSNKRIKAAGLMGRGLSASHGPTIWDFCYGFRTHYFCRLTAAQNVRSELGIEAPLFTHAQLSRNPRQMRPAASRAPGSSLRFIGSSSRKMQSYYAGSPPGQATSTWPGLLKLRGPYNDVFSSAKA